MKTLFRKATASRRRKVVSTLAALAVLAVAGIAAAYYTGSGSGSGQATLGHAPGVVAVTADPGSSVLYPGDSNTIAVTLKGTGGHNFYVATISGSVPANGSGDVLDNASGNPVAGCKAAWFSVTPASVAVGQRTTTAGISAPGLSLNFLDPNVSQDVCSDATPRVTVAAQ